VPWKLLRATVTGVDPETDEGRRRLAGILVAARQAADLGPMGLELSARPLGLPTDHPNHPGPGWVRAPVLGGALDLGVGFLGLDPWEPDRVDPVPPEVLDLLGVDAGGWWPAALDYLEDMGAMAALRWRRDPKVPLRPMGDCDVVTLLGSAMLRRALAGPDAGGMRAVAAPMRTRAWFDLSRIDPAFAAAAADCTDPNERGFARPLLVTVDEVVQTREEGKPAEIVLRDPASRTPDLRDVLYHRN
jgi:hypothetical protein